MSFPLFLPVTRLQGIKAPRLPDIQSSNPEDSPNPGKNIGPTLKTLGGENREFSGGRVYPLWCTDTRDYGGCRKWTLPLSAEGLREVHLAL